MACRDYQYEYETWLKRGREHLAAMAAMLRELRPIARKAGVAIPEPAARWFADDDAGTTGKLSKESFDAAARSLCALCGVLEAHAVALPASVVPWWTEHKAQDDHAAELTKGLETVGMDFWDMYAATDAAVPGVALKDAVSALQKAGLRVIGDGKVIVLSNDTHKVLLPREDPVNAYALAGILRRIGLSEEDFRKLLQ
jgi:hypothetical protein